MKKINSLVLGVLMLTLGFAATPAAAETVLVTNARDNGAGSFRAAVKLAKRPGVTVIEFAPGLGTIKVSAERGPITHEGTQPLVIEGNGTTIAAGTPGTVDLFVASGGGDLFVRDLTFQGGDNGIVVNVPGDTEGQISVALFDVVVRDNLRFGLLINEGDPTPEQPFAASINLVVASSQFVRNGLLETEDEDEGDVDAVRVNERGDGDITAVATDSAFNRNGADGFELDEEGPGNATLMVHNSRFNRNGVTRPGGDDGLDIDESEDGGIRLNVIGSTFNRNTDDGIGLDESGGGDLHLALLEVEASRNADSGISADENDAGGFTAEFVQVSADRNDDKGADLTEAGDGDFVGLAATSSFSANGDFGIAVEQVTPGNGVLRLVDVTLKNNQAGTVVAAGVRVIGDGF